MLGTCSAGKKGKQAIGLWLIYAPSFSILNFESAKGGNTFLSRAHDFRRVMTCDSGSSDIFFRQKQLLKWRSGGQGIPASCKISPWDLPRICIKAPKCFCHNLRHRNWNIPSNGYICSRVACQRPPPPMVWSPSSNTTSSSTTSSSTTSTTTTITTT